MRLDQVHDGPVKRALEEMADRFHAADLADYEIMTEAYKAFAKDNNYRSIIGRYLSNEQEWLKIRLIKGDDNSQGELWEKISG